MLEAFDAICHAGNVSIGMANGQFMLYPGEYADLPRFFYGHYFFRLQEFELLKTVDFRKPAVQTFNITMELLWDPAVPPSRIRPASILEEQAGTWTVAITDAGTADTFATAWAVLDTNSVVVSNGTGTSFNWTPSFSGSYTLRATVTDDDNGVAIVTLPLTVRNLRPRQVTAGFPVSGGEGTPLVLTGSVRDSAVPDDLFATRWVVTNAASEIVFD